MPGLVESFEGTKKRATLGASPDLAARGTKDHISLASWLVNACDMAKICQKIVPLLGDKLLLLEIVQMESFKPPIPQCKRTDGYRFA